MGKGRSVDFYGDIVTQTTDQMAESEVMYCTEAVTKGDALSRSTDTTYGGGKAVSKATAAVADSHQFAGIALETISAAGLLRVARPGNKRTVVQLANVADAVVALQPLCYSASVAGRLDVATVGTHHVVALSLTAGTAGNTATIELL
jgi:hypothetical protein